MSMEKRFVSPPGGPSGPFYSVVTQSGKIVALQIPNQEEARLISELPGLVQLRFDWAGIINSLACRLLDGPTSNDRDYAEEMIQMVSPYLGTER